MLGPPSRRLHSSSSASPVRILLKRRRYVSKALEQGYWYRASWVATTDGALDTSWRLCTMVYADDELDVGGTRQLHSMHDADSCCLDAPTVCFKTGGARPSSRTRRQCISIAGSYSYRFSILWYAQATACLKTHHQHKYAPRLHPPCRRACRLDCQQRARPPVPPSSLSICARPPAVHFESWDRGCVLQALDATACADNNWGVGDTSSTRRFAVASS